MMHLWAKWYVKTAVVVVAAVLGAFVSGSAAHKRALHIYPSDFYPSSNVFWFTLAGEIVGLIITFVVVLFGYFVFRRFSNKLRLAQLKLLWRRWYVKAAAGLVLVVLGFWAVAGGIWGGRGGLLEGDAIAIAQRLAKEKQPTLLQRANRWEGTYQVYEEAKCGEWTVRAFSAGETRNPENPLSSGYSESTKQRFYIDDCTGRVIGCSPAQTWCSLRPPIPTPAGEISQEEWMRRAMGEATPVGAR